MQSPALGKALVGLQAMLHKVLGTAKLQLIMGGVESARKLESIHFIEVRMDLARYLVS